MSLTDVHLYRCENAGCGYERTARIELATYGTCRECWSGFLRRVKGKGEKMSKRAICSGDLVRLKSGGPCMTVSKVEDERAEATWFADFYEVKSGLFRLCTLEQVERDSTMNDILGEPFKAVEG